MNSCLSWGNLTIYLAEPFIPCVVISFEVRKGLVHSVVTRSRESFIMCLLFGPSSAPVGCGLSCLPSMALIVQGVSIGWLLHHQETESQLPVPKWVPGFLLPLHLSSILHPVNFLTCFPLLFLYPPFLFLMFTVVALP